MDTEQLREIRREYNSHEGTAHNRINKTGVAVDNFEQVIDTAIYLAQEVEDLRCELRNKPAEHERVKFTKQEELENKVLYEEDDPTI